MALAVDGDFQEAGAGERLPDRGVGRISEDGEVTGCRIKEQPRREQSSVFQILKTRAKGANA
jgi:hypothetical protein